MFVRHSPLLRVCFAGGSTGGLFRSPLITKPSQLLSVVVANMHVDRAPLVAAPLQIKPAGHPWCDRCCDQLECGLNRMKLLGDLAWVPHGIAQWEVDEYEAGYACCFDDVLSTAHDDCSYASFFKMSCNQTHGLVTYRSKRHQDHRIDPVLFRPGDDLLCIGMGAAL